MTRFHSFLLAAACLFAFAGAAWAQSQAKPQSASGIDLKAIDRSVNPCQNFYRFACGNWLKEHPIPADESAWGRFNELHQRNQKVLRSILEQAQKREKQSAIDQRIGGFYQSCMDTTAIDRLGDKPLLPELKRIRAIRNQKMLLDEIARLQNLGIDVFFSFGPQPAPKDATMEIASVDQGGLGLPERGYYFRTDAKSKQIRQKYVAHIQKMFKLVGVPPQSAAQKAQTIMGIETDLAKASLSVTKRRNPKLLVHVMPNTQLAKLAPLFNFNEFFTRMDAPSFSSLNVAVPDFMTAFSKLLAAEPLSGLKAYLAWHYISQNAHLLGKPLVDANFAFYGRTLTGAKQLKPRWKRCVQATDGELGFDLGREFVARSFGKQGKEQTLAMVHRIETEMGKDIESLTWMSPQTKKMALVKLHAVVNKIGYPNKWRDYSSVMIRPDDYFGDTQRANIFESRRELKKIGKPVDRQEWFMTPPTVNAYYDPQQNNINFPAGILQPPFFSSAAADPVNYGAAGAVIGHELTHAFDDEGRQFDANGNLKDWWTKADATRFNKLAQCFVNEYSAFSPVPGVHLNGKLTLGENTADNGGVRLAYMALMADLAQKEIPVEKKTDGFTQAQQFFLAYAQIWCQNMRPQYARLLAQTDPHSMPRFRVNGVVSNDPQFSKAFDCKTGDKMHVVHPCRVW